VRRSRERFWAPEKRSPDKLDAYWTLYQCLLTTAKLIAPFTPFMAETLWQNLAGVFGPRAEASVHLCDYPAVDAAAIDDRLSCQMDLLREIASSGLRVRMENKLKVRQPLSKVEVILADGEHQAWLTRHDALLREELNVKQVEYAQRADQYITYQVQPNFKRLGPRVGQTDAPGQADPAIGRRRRIAGPTEPRRARCAPGRRPVGRTGQRRTCRCVCRPSRAGPPPRAKNASSC
jgi:isoleucyl-tRNA synthetase